MVPHYGVLLKIVKFQRFLPLSGDLYRLPLAFEQLRRW